MTSLAPTKAFARIADFQVLPIWILFSCVCLQWPTMSVQADEPNSNLNKLHYFESHIRPLLHSKCVKCHGESLQKGELRLDSLEALLHGGESGPAAVPGKPDESLLLDAVK